MVNVYLVAKHDFTGKLFVFTVLVLHMTVVIILTWFVAVAGMSVFLTFVDGLKFGGFDGVTNVHVFGSALFVSACNVRMVMLGGQIIKFVVSSDRISIAVVH